MRRQGDLLFIPVEKIEGKIDKNKVLVRGAGGHAHTVQNGTVFRDEKGTMFIRASNKCSVLHLNPDGTESLDHKTINLPKGLWRVQRQQTFTPQGWEVVND